MFRSDLIYSFLAGTTIGIFVALFDIWEVGDMFNFMKV